MMDDRCSMMDGRDRSCRSYRHGDTVAEAADMLAAGDALGALQALWLGTDDRCGGLVDRSGRYGWLQRGCLTDDHRMCRRRRRCDWLCDGLRYLRLLDGVPHEGAGMLWPVGRLVTLHRAAYRRSGVPGRSGRLWSRSGGSMAGSAHEGSGPGIVVVTVQFNDIHISRHVVPFPLRFQILLHILNRLGLMCKITYRYC
jgi:hypothetical protein